MKTKAAVQVLPDIVSKNSFEAWHGPREFFLKADECMSRFATEKVLAMTGVQHLFDAYVAGLFARVWNDHRPCLVRLAAGRFPDAQLRDGDEVLDLEITMAGKKDRQIAAEHRQLRERRERGEVLLLPSNGRCDRDYAFEAIPRVCGQKAERYLGSCQSDRIVEAALLIYVNFETWSGAILSDGEMRRLTDPWRSNFRAIWLLSGARIFRAWPSPLAMTAMSNPLA